jgi:hypothetical protein
MPKTTNDENGLRDRLNAKRNLLFAELSKNPMETSLAIEIRLIDDQVAELTERMVERRKSRLD